MTYFIKRISAKFILKLLDGVESYNENRFYNRHNFEKYLNEHDEAHPGVWYGIFENGRLNALLLVKIGYPDMSTALLAEVQSFISGYGMPLIDEMLDIYPNIWWAVDNEHGYEDEARLVEYYKTFGLKEYYLEASKWVNGKHQYFFYRGQDAAHEKAIIDNIDKAACQKIEFPDDEIPEVSKQDTIITHRVSADAGKFEEGEVVLMPWNEPYEVTEKLTIDDIDDSPYAEELSNEQYEYLQGFDVIDVLVLRRKNPQNTLPSGTINAIFDETVRDYNNLFGMDMSYMKLKVSRDNEYKNGNPCFDFEPDEWAGTHTNLGYIIINPDLGLCMKNYGLTCDLKEFTKRIIAHELAHEVWHSPYLADEDFKFEILQKAQAENFDTVYLQTVSENKLGEETFCEYMSDYIFRNGMKLSLISDRW